MKNSERILRELDKMVPNPKCPLNYTRDYELLLAVMLSAQTTDERVNMVTKELFKYDLRQLSTMDTEKIEEIIKPVGTQKRKSAYIKEIAKILLEKTDGKVPYDRAFVEGLPGVGHKTCNVVFSEIFNEPTLAVDTHVARTSKRLGLAGFDADVVEIEEALCNFFPKSSWSKVHVQLVLFGRHKCKATKPLCDDCPFKNKECKKTQE
ncbi:MAG TPA: endonuclease III [Firmicutes bacterium]|nr:endonuclease III [Bacillota bacterium]